MADILETTEFECRQDVDHMNLFVVPRITAAEKFRDAAEVTLVSGAALTVITIGILVSSQLIAENNTTATLQKNIAALDYDYGTWAASSPNASIDEKHLEIQKIAARVLEDPTNTGIAFDSATSQSFCLWNKNSTAKEVSDAITLSSKDADCSHMDILSVPEGSTVEKNIKQESIALKATKESETSSLPLIPEEAYATGAVIIVGGVLVSGGVIGGKAFKASKRRKRHQVRKWNDLMKRHDVVRKAWAEYELDAMKMLDYPILSDMREKVTVNLHMALRNANSLRPAVAESASSEDFDIDDYAHAIAELESSFHIAETEAKRIQWSKFNAEEQKRLATAKNLLSFVLDGGASEFERQAAYKRLNKEIAGLITIPTPTILVIEESIRSMIEA